MKEHLDQDLVEYRMKYKLRVNDLELHLVNIDQQLAEKQWYSKQSHNEDHRFTGKKIIDHNSLTSL